jgi:exonuclease SbcD
VTRATFGPPVPERSHEAVLGAAMDRVRADLATRPAGTRSVVVSHAFVTGGRPSDSERDLGVGGAATAPISVFDGVDYVALGHLHGPQKVGTHGRYAGSPLALSFSEARHVKSTAVVELMLGTAVCDLVPTPVPRVLAAIRGTIEELLVDPTLADHETAWVQATITDAVQPRDAMARLRARFPHAVTLAFEPEGALPGATGSYAARLQGLDDTALIERFIQDVRGDEMHDAERELLDAALVAGRTTQVAA